VSEPKSKSFEISKMAVWEAYRRVKANKGGVGVDGESMAEFEHNAEFGIMLVMPRGRLCRVRFRGAVFVV
jgi:hypothetical protein